MDHTYVDEKSLKTLEDYALFLTSGILTLNTLHNLQVRAISLGIMSEEQMERSNSIIWELRRLMQQYQAQTVSVLDLLPEDFNAETILTKLKAKEIVRAKALTRKKKEEK